jgi:thymidylate synthase
MKQYHDLLKKVIGEGDVVFEPRTQTYTIGISSHQSVYDLRNGFPLVTTKNVPPRLPFEELFWKLRGERNVKSLVDRKVDIWTANAFDRYLKNSGMSGEVPKHSKRWNEEFVEYKDKVKNDSEFAVGAGDLGPVYGNQWRHWKDKEGKEIDQLERLIDGIKGNKGSRYHTLSAWNVGDLGEMALGPCPFWHQFTAFKENLDLTMVQRSCDTYLGVPFNVAQDALLLEMVAKETGLKARFFNHQTINTHIYLGVSPRADFWTSEKKVGEFKEKFEKVNIREGYLDLRNWYLEKVDKETEVNERKDHMPFILEQLSKEPRELPTISLEDIPLLEAINKPVKEVVKVNNYEFCKWDSKAEMAV